MADAAEARVRQLEDELSTVKARVRVFRLVL